MLLLDEPLSALDANLREEMRVELKRIQRELGISTVFVTHDQSEALALSDKVVVMSKGRVEQEGTPEQVYNEPNSAFVADFLGHSNILAGRVSGLKGGLVEVRVDDGPTILARPRDGHSYDRDQPVRLVLRAERLKLDADHEQAPGHTVLDGRVETVDYQGQEARYFVAAGQLMLQAINMIDRRPFTEGAPVKIRIRAEDCVLLQGATD